MITFIISASFDAIIVHVVQCYICAITKGLSHCMGLKLLSLKSNFLLVKEMQANSYQRAACRCKVSKHPFVSLS